MPAAEAVLPGVRRKVVALAEPVPVSSKDVGRYAGRI
jgi:hypothetical protein